MLAADYVFCAAVVFMIMCNLYYRTRIAGDRIAMQWGIDGQPTRYAPKTIGLWGIVAFALAIRLLIWAASTWAPEMVHGAELGVLLFSLIAAAAHLAVLRVAAKARQG